jgi:hypothetical protein
LKYLQLGFGQCGGTHPGDPGFMQRLWHTACQEQFAGHNQREKPRTGEPERGFFNSVEEGD